MSSYKFDIFVALEFLDQNSFEVYEELSKDENLRDQYEKALGWILPLWMIGASRDSDHAKLIERFNRDCNNVWLDLKAHPSLRSKLLAGCGLGRKTNHKFFKAAAPKYDNEIYRIIRQMYPDMTIDEGQLWVRKNTPSDFKELLEMMGTQSAESKTLATAYGKLRKALLK